LQLTSARSCNYSCTSSWWWVSTPETCRAAYRNVINWIQSYLVGQLLNSIHDARTHVHKIQVSLKSDKNSGYFTWTSLYADHISPNSAWNAEFSRVQILWSIMSYWKLCRLWHNEPDRPQMTVRHMRIAPWIPKATNTHSQRVILIAYPQQQ